MLPDDPALVRARLAHIADAYGVSSAPAARSAPPEVRAGDPPVWRLGGDLAEAEAAMTRAYADEQTRESALSPVGGGDPGQPEADPGPPRKRPGDKT
jgi:hypothetical protein